MRNYLTKVSQFVNVCSGGLDTQTIAANQYERYRDGRFNIVQLLDAIWYIVDGKEHCLIEWVDWNLPKKSIGVYYDA